MKIFCELLKRMCLGIGVWGLCGIRGRRLIFSFSERGAEGCVASLSSIKIFTTSISIYLNNEAEFYILIYREIPVVIFYFEGRSGPKAPLFFYTTNIYRVLSNLAHLNNEPDITMSYLYREVPAWLFYFKGSANLRTLYNIFLYIYICPHYLFLYL